MNDPSSSSARAAKASGMASRPGWATAAYRPKRSKAASKHGSEPRASARHPSEAAEETRARPHRLGHARAAEGRPDRLSLADLVRFVDPAAVFLFVKPSEATAVAETFQATPFDIEGVHWSHRGDKCTFDVMIEELGLITKPLSQLGDDRARQPDTARLDLALEAPGSSRRLARPVTHVRQ